jgi:hypothetical protein
MRWMTHGYSVKPNKLPHHLPIGHGRIDWSIIEIFDKKREVQVSVNSFNDRDESEGSFTKQSVIDYEAISSDF